MDVEKKTEAKSLMEYNKKVTNAAAQHEAAKAELQAAELTKPELEKMKQAAVEKCNAAQILAGAEFEKSKAQVKSKALERDSSFEQEKEEVQCKLDVIIAGAGGNSLAAKKSLLAAEGKVGIARARHELVKTKAVAQGEHDERIIALQTHAALGALVYKQQHRDMQLEQDKSLANIKAACKRDVSGYEETINRLEIELASLSEAEEEKQPTLKEQIKTTKALRDKIIENTDFTTITKLQEFEQKMAELKQKHMVEAPAQVDVEIAAATELLNHAGAAAEKQFMETKEDLEAKSRAEMLPPRAQTEPSPKNAARRRKSLELELGTTSNSKETATSAKENEDGDDDLPAELQDLAEGIFDLDTARSV